MDSTAKQLPHGITRENILRAIAIFDADGMPDGFKPSHTYEFLLNGKSYPPPAIVALAAEDLNAIKLAPGFRAGKGTPCFQILEDCGFKVTKKERPNG